LTLVEPLDEADENDYPELDELVPTFEHEENYPELEELPLPLDQVLPEDLEPMSKNFFYGHNNFLRQ
jgi:hypothetical protein